MIQLTCCINNEDNRKLNKNITPVRNVACEIVTPCNGFEPVLKVDAENLDIMQYNYFWLSAFNKYYFLKEPPTLINNNRAILYLREDTLFTFANKLRFKKATIRRSESKYNNYLVDDRIVPRSERSINKYKIGTVGGQATGHHIVVTVSGGN